MTFLSTAKGGNLISEGILTLVPLPNNGAKSLPWTESLNFPPFTVNNYFKLSVQGSDLAPFLGNGTKVKAPSEIKPPLMPIFFPLIIFLYISWNLQTNLKIESQKLFSGNCWNSFSCYRWIQHQWRTQRKSCWHSQWHHHYSCFCHHFNQCCY